MLFVRGPVACNWQIYGYESVLNNEEKKERVCRKTGEENMFRQRHIIHFRVQS